MCGLCGGDDDLRPGDLRLHSDGPGPARRSVLKAMGLGSALGIVPAMGFAGAAHRPPSREADLILHNARVHTVGRAGARARAVAIAGDRILAAGDPGEVMRLAGPRTRRINLSGRTVVPGLNDSHLHQFRMALDRENVPLIDARSIADVVAAVAARVEKTPAGEWVQAQAGWHESLLAEGRLPTRGDLDPVSPDNPVHIPRGGHVAAVNSLALERAGITRDTPDPEGGVIVRDAAGEPTGVLLERAKDLLAPVLPPPPPTERQRRLLRDQMSALNAMGITSVTEPGLSPGQIQTYVDLWREGLLSTRVHLLWRVRTLSDVEAAVDAFAPRAGDAMLRFDGLKYLADGGVEGAFLSEPYQIVPGEQTDPGYRGVLLLPPGGLGELEEMYLRAARHGFQVHTHVVGDATFETLIDLLTRVDEEVPLAPLRWALLHLFLPSRAGLDTMRRLGVVATVQDHPVLLGFNMVRWWGAERAARAIPVREIRDAGVHTGGGTDAPVVPANPFWSLWWMVTRRNLRGEVLGPEHGIGAGEALRLYTAGSAYTQFAEDAVGSIEPGMLADLAVLDADPLAVEPEAIKDIGVTMTLLGGRIVYERS